MKKIFVSILFFASLTFAQFKFGEAKRIVHGNRSWSAVSNRGYGGEPKYWCWDRCHTLVHRQQIHTNFLYSTIGYHHFPGRQNFYKVSNYSSFSSNVLVVSPGVRYYFKPILESVVLLMPIVDIGVNWALFEKLHQFKIESGKNNYIEEVTKFGFHFGAGFSMFILDVITYYNYFPKTNIYHLT